MKPHFEKVPQDQDSCFHVIVRDDPSFVFNWHYHPEYELTLILNSTGQRLVGNGIADYGPGDLVLLGPNLPHSWRSAAGSRVQRTTHRAIVVQFRPEFLGESFFGLKETAPIARMLERSGNGLALGDTDAGKRAATMLAELPSLSPPDRLITLLTILRQLSTQSKMPPLSLGKVRPVYRMESQRRVDTICAYLEKKSSEDIDYAAAARSVDMDQASLCRFFKRATGRTITTYVNELRIGGATRLLMETDLNIIDVGCRVGFYNYSNFNRQFKRIKGVTPAAIRREFRAALS